MESLRDSNLGLPLTRVKEQGAGFRSHLLQKPEVEFNFRGATYRVGFSDALVFPQGFAAVTDRMKAFVGINMLADIGNGEVANPEGLQVRFADRAGRIENSSGAPHMNIMKLVDSRVVQSACFTEFYGTHQCTLGIREQMLSRFGKSVEDNLIDAFIRNGKADIDQRYQDAMRQSAMEYVSGIFRRLREHGYDPELMRLYVVGGEVGMPLAFQVLARGQNRGRFKSKI